MCLTLRQNMCIIDLYKKSTVLGIAVPRSETTLKLKLNPKTNDF